MSKKSIHVAFRINVEKEPRLAKIIAWLKENRYKNTDVIKSCLNENLYVTVRNLLLDTEKDNELKDFREKV